MEKAQKGIFTATGETVVNIFALGSESTGTVADALTLARETLQPSIIEARIDTAKAITNGVKELVELGMEVEDAKKILLNGLR